MGHHLTSGAILHHHPASRPGRPLVARRPVCVECHCAARALYPMNGRCYCTLCLLAWCLSLPEVQADLCAASWQEREG
jgi:hypothetical protein